MRILIISNLYPPFVLGGYEILCEQVATRLDAMGHEVLVLTSDHGVASSSVDSHDELHIQRSLKLVTPFDRAGSVSRLRRLLVGEHNARKTRTVLDEYRPDLVYVWSQLRLTVSCAKAAQQAGYATALNLNDEHLAGYLPAKLKLTPKKVVRHVSDRSVFNRTTLSDLDLNRATCISRCLKDRLLDQGVDVSNAEVIYQGIPIEHFPSKSNPGEISKTARILFVGQLHAYKGPHTLIRAAQLVAAKRGADRLELTVAGTGEKQYERELMDLADHSGVRVTLPGWVDRKQVPELLREHDIFVFPSEWHEPFGLTQLEAMASGLPVVSTAVGGHGECLEHEQNSLVFAPGNHEQLASHLERLIEDDQLAADLAQNGRAMVEKEFTVDRYARDLEGFLLRALNAHNSREAFAQV